MRDRDIVAAIVAGDPAGLAAAYDAYAASLHAYCRRLLADPADAADAVRDTFVIAAVKVVALRDWDRLRPWLYAVARNECHRRLRDRARQVGLDETSEITIASADIAALAADEELQSLVPAAIGGLNLGDREVIELNLRHDLAGADLADALGIPASEVDTLVSRARGQLERSLGALLVARTGRGQCAELDAILGHWDGRLTVPLRRRVSGHIGECETCGARPHHELTPAMLASILPLVALPAGLRQQVLRLVSDADPDAVRSRDEVVARAGEFGYAGFPEQIAPAGGARRSEGAGRPDTPGGPSGASGKPTRRAVLGVAALAILLVGGGVATYLLLNGAGPASGAAAGSQAVTTAPSSGVSSVGALSPASADLTTTPSASPGRFAPGASSSSGSSPPAKSALAGSSPSGSPTGGTLTESPGIVQLPKATVGGLSIGSFTLTAAGGPVTYAISGGGLYLSVSPASGTLAAGQTQTVSVSLTLNPNGAPPPSNTTLTVSPADLTVSVEYPVSVLATRSRS